LLACTSIMLHQVPSLLQLPTRRRCRAQVPHYYVTVVNRMDALLGLRAQINEALAASGEGKLSVNDFIVKASALVRDTALGLAATACTASHACLLRLPPTGTVKLT